MSGDDASGLSLSNSDLREKPGNLIYKSQNFIIQKVEYSFPVLNLVRSRPPRPRPDPKSGVRGAENGVRMVVKLYKLLKSLH